MKYQYVKNGHQFVGVAYAYCSEGGYPWRFILGSVTADVMNPDAVLDKWYQLPGNWYVVWL